MTFQRTIRIVKTNHDFHEIYSTGLISELNDYFLRNTNLMATDSDVYCLSLGMAREVEDRSALFRVSQSLNQHLHIRLDFDRGAGTHCTS